MRLTIQSIDKMTDAEALAIASEYGEGYSTFDDYLDSKHESVGCHTWGSREWEEAIAEVELEEAKNYLKTWIN